MKTAAERDLFRLIGAELDGKFRVKRLVAEGGFAVVYRAEHVLLARPVALKVLKHLPAPDAAARAAFLESFTREARTVVRLTHPNIVQALDLGVSTMPSGERAPWMALEWLEGRTLRAEVAASPGRRSPAEAVAYLRPVVEAVAYAHEEGVAHRDIKPANVMVARTRRGTQLKLLDFGIAKVVDDAADPGTGATQTSADMQAFSLHYAAPEQLGGTRTGPWTDVHALGLLLSELMTGDPPFEGADRTEVMCRVLSADRPTPARRGVDAGAFEAVLARALALKPVDRYRHAGELLAALDVAAGSGASEGRGAVAVAVAWASDPSVATGGDVTAAGIATEATGQASALRAVRATPAPSDPGVTETLDLDEVVETPGSATTLRGATATRTLSAAAPAPRPRASRVVGALLAVVAAAGAVTLVVNRRPDSAGSGTRGAESPARGAHDPPPRVLAVQRPAAQPVDPAASASAGSGATPPAPLAPDATAPTAAASPGVATPGPSAAAAPAPVVAATPGPSAAAAPAPVVAATPGPSAAAAPAPVVAATPGPSAAAAPAPVVAATPGPSAAAARVSVTVPAATPSGARAIPPRRPTASSHVERFVPPPSDPPPPTAPAPAPAPRPPSATPAPVHASPPASAAAPSPRPPPPARPAARPAVDLNAPIDVD